MEDRFPNVTKRLIEALNEAFPNQCPRLEDTERMVWFRAGQRATVDFLVEQHKRQNENILRG